MIEKDITFRREELEKFSTLELDRILRTELDSDTPDRKTVLMLLSILEDRDPTDPQKRPEGAAQVWNEFANRTEGLEQSIEKPIRKSKKWFLPTAAAAAVALILLMTVPQTVGAENIFEILGRWTREVFYLFDKEVTSSDDEYIFQTDHEGLQQVYDAVVAQGVTDPVVPTWIPEEYELTELRVVSPGENTKVYARFEKEHQYIQIGVEIYEKNRFNKYPKDDIDAIRYDSCGIQYFIVPNKETWKVAWNCGTSECSIVTNEEEKLLYKMLDSIQERFIK